MATHARFGGGDAGKGAGFDGGVAVATINAHARNMVFVAECYGLVQGNINFGYIVEAIDVENDAEESSNDYKDYDDTGSGEGICTAREYLRHLDLNLP